jgi:7,8-dihydropterin-6-yl-methyl-4-(beta-D-ribofuranosyl)aminobenzene 5'-phosphate synthase
MEERIPATVAYFAEEVSPKVKYVVPMHCSGFKAKTALREALGDCVVPVGVGVKMVF